MAKPEHLKILRRSVEAWNKWRWENAAVKPDLSNAGLDHEDLSGATREPFDAVAPMPDYENVLTD